MNRSKTSDATKAKISAAMKAKHQARVAAASAPIVKMHLSAAARKTLKVQEARETATRAVKQTIRKVNSAPSPMPLIDMIKAINALGFTVALSTHPKE